MANELLMSHVILAAETMREGQITFPSKFVGKVVSSKVAFGTTEIKRKQEGSLPLLLQQQGGNDC